MSKLYKEAIWILAVQLAFIAIVYSVLAVEVNYPAEVYQTTVYEGGKVNTVIGYWSTESEAAAARDAITCPAATIQINDNEGDKDALFNKDVWRGYFRECELDTGYKEVFWILGCESSQCTSDQTGDAGSMLPADGIVRINVAAMEIIALQALIGFAFLWTVRKLVKIMNRS